MVYVLNEYGQPLMPTKRHGKVRRLLNNGEAVITKRCPFTIRLLHETGSSVQDVVLGVDAGSKHIGLSACTETQELYAADVELRNDIVDLLSTRRECRRTRRNRKTRYRKPRFDNRVKAKHKGWLAPSIEQKIGTHLSAIRKVHEILPVSSIVVEVAQFDIQKIKNPSICGTEYQQGEQLDFWNVREYVLWRDGHTCQCCKGKSTDMVLNVHHIESRKTGGDAPNNLITLCETCHQGYHTGTVKLPARIKRGMKFDDATFMNVMRWALYERLKAVYPSVNLTYGYITKNTRIRAGLSKEHYIDARCITRRPDVAPSDSVYYMRKVRRHNRQIHKLNPIKGGKRKLNQAPYTVYGFRLFDKVKLGKQECFVYGRRSSGYFKLRAFDGTIVSPGVSYKRLKLIEPRGSYITERKPSQLATRSLQIWYNISVVERRDSQPRELLVP